MCLILPSRVLAVADGEAEVELADGQRATASTALKPGVAVGDYVLVDRGLIVETITAEEADALVQMYQEIGALLDQADAEAEADGEAAAEPVWGGQVQVTAP